MARKPATDQGPGAPNSSLGELVDAVRALEQATAGRRLIGFLVVTALLAGFLIGMSTASLLVLSGVDFAPAARAEGSERVVTALAPAVAQPGNAYAEAARPDRDQGWWTWFGFLGAARAAAGEGEAKPDVPHAPEAFQKLVRIAPGKADRLDHVPEGAVPAWREYAVAPPAEGPRPRIAVIIDDVGPNLPLSRRAAALPAPLTLALLPYAQSVRKLAAAGRANGHELMVHLPMEAADAADAGPHALRHVHTRPELVRHLDWALSRFDGYVGVNNHMGSLLTAESEPMRVVMSELKRRGLLFIDSRTTAETKAADEARAAGVPTLDRDVFIDHTDSETSIRAALAALERQAAETGHAIGIGHPRPITLKVLEPWLRDVEQRGFDLVPVSALFTGADTDTGADAAVARN